MKKLFILTAPALALTLAASTAAAAPASVLYDFVLPGGQHAAIQVAVGRPAALTMNNKARAAKCVFHTDLGDTTLDLGTEPYAGASIVVVADATSEAGVASLISFSDVRGTWAKSMALRSTDCIVPAIAATTVSSTTLEDLKWNTPRTIPLPDGRMLTVTAHEGSQSERPR